MVQADPSKTCRFNSEMDFLLQWTNGLESGMDQRPVKPWLWLVLSQCPAVLQEWQVKFHMCCPLCVVSGPISPHEVLGDQLPLVALDGPDDASLLCISIWPLWKLWLPELYDFHSWCSTTHPKIANWMMRCDEMGVSHNLGPLNFSWPFLLT